ncbi:HupE/UreJ family protein [Paragemmobacter straminiformis]|uniref:HupE/UreJ family protein n=1 Tax=Paragemmobacter straminiformis TaxID=2045119 RepID=A0A842IAI4_9RHOB|nr:HupE/UreJ family protein [Gemmobacter straminiformis]MBC2835998.1 HupE/UreJ family protein [Gemmobacter straminiformis]
MFAHLRRLALGLLLALAQPLAAHEVLPSIGDFQQDGDTLAFDIRTNLEGFVAGIDLTLTADTNAAPEAASYDSLRALPPAALESRFRSFWPRMAPRVFVRIDGVDQPLTLLGVSVPEVGDVNLPRASTISFTAPVPAGAKTVQVGWAAPFGALVIRQNGVDKPYDGYLEAGAMSDPIALGGGDAMSPAQAFASYIPIGFDHIVPKGLDHILFVLGLFFLSTQLRPLLWQVSAFTIAHTVTLGLGALGYVAVPASIVEPVIAASIVFVAVENILTQGLSRWRPVVVFCFGLLHGLGFASVLGEIGLPEGNFFPALIGFNVGVELGQLAVITAAFLLVGLWFRKKPWYRARISVPASGAIALVGAWWFVERIMG